MSTKHTVFLKEIIFKYLPEFNNPDLQTNYLNIIQKYPKSSDVENLIEHALAHLGGYNFIDEEYRDFDDVDNSDSKTVTVNLNTGKAEVIGVENKIGAIRLTLYNPFSTSKLDYMFLPKHAVKLLSRPCYGKNKHKERLVPGWSANKQNYGIYEPYRLTSFVELATMTECKFYELHPELVQPKNIESSDASKSDNV